MANCETYKFQSTRPVWGATEPASIVYTGGAFQSTRPVWGATKYFSQSLSCL